LYKGTKKYSPYSRRKRGRLFHHSDTYIGSRDSSVSIVTLRAKCSGVRLSAKAKVFIQNLDTDCGLHSAAYVIGTGSPFLSVKVATASSWPLTCRLFCHSDTYIGSRDSSVSKVTRLRAKWSGVRLPAKAKVFIQNLDTDCGLHSAAYVIGTGSPLPSVKVATASRWPLIIQ
jgi:hypothetical protein